MNREAPVWLLAGYFHLHLFNRFLTAHVCDRTAGIDYAMGISPMSGIGLHSFIDGVVYAVDVCRQFLHGSARGAGDDPHEFPEGIVTYVLLVRSGLSDRKAARLAFLAAPATTPVGALAAGDP